MEFNHAATNAFGRFSFEIVNADLAIVNGVRRAIMTLIPVIGFSAETVDIRTNTGPLHNEIISHRIAMIPLHLTASENDADPGQAYTLNVKNTGDSTMNITTHDLRREGLSTHDIARIFPANAVSKTPILITRLRPGEELDLTATTIKATASQDAGFCPASLCTFSFLLDATAAAAASDVLDKERAYLKNEYGDPIAFRIEIESECGLKPAIIVTKAISALIAAVDTVAKEAQTGDVGDQSSKVSIGTEHSRYMITLKEEDDTLGNMLQSTMHN